MRHEEIPALPFELVREAVVNALVHRDYDILGAKCRLMVSADTVTVTSPGLPVEPVTLRQSQDFSAGRGMRGKRFGGTDVCTILDCVDDLRGGTRPELGYKRFQRIWRRETAAAAE